MANVEITAKVVNGLAAKVGGLDLTPEERAVLDTVLKRATAAEERAAAAEDFVFTQYYPELKAADVDERGRRWGLALGMESRPL